MCLPALVHYKTIHEATRTYTKCLVCLSMNRGSLFSGRVVATGCHTQVESRARSLTALGSVFVSIRELTSPRLRVSPIPWLLISVISSVIAVHGCERVFKNKIRHSPALRYPLDLIEAPVDSQVDSALAVLFLSL